MTIEPTSSLHIGMFDQKLLVAVGNAECFHGGAGAPPPPPPALGK